MEKLAIALNNLGFTATVTKTEHGDFLKVAEQPDLRSPEVRGDRYVWAGYWSTKPATMATRIAAFIKSSKAESNRKFVAQPVGSVAAAEAQLVAEWAKSDPKAGEIIKNLYDIYTDHAKAWAAVVKTAQAIMDSRTE